MMETRILERSYLQGHLSMPRLLLQLEGLAILVASIVCYGYQGYSWLAFILLLLVPDLAAIGYLVNNRIGSIVYNLAHTYTLPLLLGGLSLAFETPLGLQLALIWLAHIGMDRSVGYGLKYEDGFKETHLSRV
jgi:hypothetical protein